MCTATWILRADGYELFFNRDERRRRRPAAPPRVHGADATPFLAPVDGDAGGTWIAVNGHGLAVCLLNRYQDEVRRPAPRRPTSRGRLVMVLAGHRRADDALEQLRGLDLGRFRPFDLVLAEPDAPVRAAAWTGVELRPPADAEPPLASSGFDAAGAVEHRGRLWREVSGADAEVDAAACLAFQRSHRPERGPYSPCMHRPDARTVSLTHVVVAPSEVSMAYADGPPCTAPLGPPLHLPRLGASGLAGDG